MTLTLTDLFAGFGGASSGAVQVEDIELVMAANHWPLAVEVHNSNHPDADHACVDLHLEDPAYFPSTDLLWASPECTQWSQANGKKPDLARVLGSRRDQVKGYGNAVTPPSSRDLMTCISEAAA